MESNCYTENSLKAVGYQANTRKGDWVVEIKLSSKAKEVGKEVR